MNSDFRLQISDFKKTAGFLFAVCSLISAMSVFSACSRKEEPSAKTEQAEKTLYHCAMHPEIVSDKPGECPICHMKLTPIQKTSAPSTGAAIPGQAAVRLSPEIEQRIGVKMAEAQVRELTLPVRAAARAAYDPQLYSAALEHQEAVKFLQQAQSQGSSEGLSQAESTVRSSQLRLRQMGLSDGQIQEISRPGYDPSSLLVGSKGGKVWVYADVSDNQAGSIRSGQPVDLTSPALPGKTFIGTVRGIDPIVNAETRTVRVRIAADNTAGALRPGTYVNAVIKASLGSALTVPESAVIDTGTRQLVYVQTGPGAYEPRSVRVGRQAEGFVEILEGLKEGEKVTRSANFLIDSESRIQAAAQESQHKH
jgi:membrane fusion protein, copper/silver efflux system